MTEPTIKDASVLYRFADMSDPGVDVIDPAEVQGFFFYIGGRTPHVWTPEQVDRQRLRYAVPIYVRDPNRSTYGDGLNDALEALHQTETYKVAPGTRVVLDLETEIAYDYSHGFRDGIAAHGMWTVTYGSASTIFRNYIPGGGVWVADWTGHPFEYPGDHVWATQYGDATQLKMPWDASEVDSLAYVWDRMAAPQSHVRLMTASRLGGTLTDGTSISWG